MRIIRKSPILPSPTPTITAQKAANLEQNLYFFVERKQQRREVKQPTVFLTNKFWQRFGGKKITPIWQSNRIAIGTTLSTLVLAIFFSIFFPRLHAAQITRVFFTPASQSITVSHAGSTTIQAEVEAEKQIVGVQVWANITGTVPDTITLTPYAVSGMDLILHQLETTSEGETLKLVFLVPPSSSFLTISDTISLADIDVIASNPGQMTITFDPTLTKILEYQTSTNLISQLSAGSMTFLSPTPTPTPRPTNTPVPTAIPTFTPIPTVTPSSTPTPTTQPTATSTPILSATSIPSNTPTLTPSPTATITPTSTPTPSIFPTPTSSPSPSASPTPTLTPTITPTITSTPTSTPTISPSPTPTLELTATVTQSPTPTPTVTKSATPTPTNQPQPTSTPTPGPTQTPTPQPTSTPTQIPTPTPIKLLLEEENQGNILGIFDQNQNKTTTLKPSPTPSPTKSAVKGVMTETQVACENQIVGFSMILGALFLLLLLTHIYILPDFSLTQIGTSLATVIVSTSLISILDCDHRALFWFFISLMVLGGEFILRWMVEMLIGE